MRVFIKTIDDGPKEIDINPRWTVGQLKEHIWITLLVPVEQQRLIYMGYPLISESIVPGISEDSNIFLLKQLW